jgi:hypothetical protein
VFGVVPSLGKLEDLERAIDVRGDAERAHQQDACTLSVFG